MPVLRWICGIVLVLCTARAMGAELELVTGDRLLGQIIERSEGFSRAGGGALVRFRASHERGASWWHPS